MKDDLFLRIYCRKMQALDNRESRIRNSFAKLEDETGKICKETIIRLVTVSYEHEMIKYAPLPPPTQWNFRPLHKHL